MLEKITTTTNSVVETAKRHRAKIAVVTTVTTMLYLNRKRVAQMNEFLVEHDLFDTYYLPED